MVEIKKRIDGILSQSARRLYRNRLKTLFAMFLLIAVLGSHLLQLEINTATEGYLDKSHTELSDFKGFIEQFGRGMADVCIAVKATDNIFELGFLNTLKSMHDEIEENVPLVANTLSLVNARNIRSEDGALVVGEIFEEWPQNTEELLQLKDVAYKNPLYRNVLFSEDAKYAMILIETQGLKKADDVEEVDIFKSFESGERHSYETHDQILKKQFTTSSDTSKIITSLYEIIQKYDAPGFEIYISGSRAVNHYVSTALMHDMNLFFGLSILIVIIILSIMFKRLTGVIFPLLVAALSLLSTFGLMVYFEEPLTLPSQILPAFLIAVGVGYVVHILSIFYRHYDGSGNKEDAIAFSFGHSGLAIILTAATTAFGLLSFVTADLAPVQGFGVFASAGVMFALLYALILIPALVSIIPIKRKQNNYNGVNKKTAIDKLLVAISQLTLRHPKPILFLSAIVFMFSIYGIMNMRFSHDIIRWMPEDSILREGTEKIDKVLYGSNILHVVLDFKNKESLYDPVILNKLEKSGQVMEQLNVGPVFVGKAWSVTAILKEINQALHDGQEEYYILPQDKNLVAQAFLLFENSGSDDLSRFTDKQYQKAHFHLKLPYLDAVYYDKFFASVKNHFQETYPEAGITLTGIFKIYVQTFSATLTSMTKSYFFSIVTVSMLMLLFLGLRYGLLSLIPNLFPIIFSLGLMGWLNLSMNFSTMMMACIALGIVVDDTIHFIHTFKKYFAKTGDTAESIRMTFLTTGRAMLVTSVVLTFGFLVFLLARLENFHDFGLITAVAIAMALLADFFITPSILVLSKNKREAS